MEKYKIAGIMVNGCTLSGFNRLREDVSHIVDGEEFLKSGWKTRKYILRTIHRVRQYHNWFGRDEESLFLKELESVLQRKSPSHNHQGQPAKVIGDYHD